ncbi:MAG: hypothetical protein ACK5NT_15105 [Pyrinomonadaceae bacterium]
MLLIVVAFASFACLAGGFALAFGAAYLGNAQKWVLVFFIVLFPVFGIGVISFLVLRHATKLVVEKTNAKLLWKVIPAETQKKTLEAEVKHLASILKVPNEQQSELRSAYIVAEDLALRKIQEESKIPLFRNVMVGESDYNAIYVDSDLLTCIQVNFIVTPEMRQEKINSMLKRTSITRKFMTAESPGTRVRLLLVLVTQLEREAENKLRSSLVSKFSNTPVDVDIRLLDFQGLQRVYSE